MLFNIIIELALIHFLYFFRNHCANAFHDSIETASISGMLERGHQAKKEICHQIFFIYQKIIKVVVTIKLRVFIQRYGYLWIVL